MANKDLRCLRQDEIMVGNYITDEWASPGCAFEVITFNQRNVTYGAKFKARWVNTRPVLLTLPIVEKFGFIPRRNYYSEGITELIIEGHELFLSETPGKFGVCTGEYEKVFLREIEFVHELQNIFYWIQGKHLIYTA
jgi:hypothetical protein